jgi:hypothetical protein
MLCGLLKLEMGSICTLSKGVTIGVPSPAAGGLRARGNLLPQRLEVGQGDIKGDTREWCMHLRRGAGAGVSLTLMLG